MIRKISVQDIVSKRSSKNGRDGDSSTAGEPNRNERDFLIERLTRKHATPTIVASPAKVIKRPPTSKHKGTGRKFGKKWLWFGVPLCLIIVAFIVLQFMVSAVVTITPKKMTVPIDSKLLATISATTSPNTIVYQIITLNSTDAETVVATGTVATKPQKATGQITIFNSFGSAPQTLIKNTRFETADGLIYRLQNSVSVPGQTGSGSSILPGSLTVTVLADQVGAKYNVGLSDFTIPGFKNSGDRYTKIFARSKTVMTGGSDGNTLGVDAGARKTAQDAIETRLKDSLLRQVQAQKTADSVIFGSASKISFKPLPDTAGPDAGHVVVSEQGTVSSVVFDKKTLAKLLLGNSIASIGSSVEVQGLESLNFDTAISSSSPIWQAKPFAFSLNGKIQAIGVVDANKLLNDILGLSRGDLQKVLANYSGIDKTSVVIRPFWRSSFPTDPTKIKIEIMK